MHVPIGGGRGDTEGGVRQDYRTGVLLSTEERREVLGRIGGRGMASQRRSGRGGKTKSDDEEGPPPATKYAGPGTPGGSRGIRSAETEMATLAATALEGGGTM